MTWHSEGLLLTVLRIVKNKKLYLKSIILLKTKMQKLYPIFDQNESIPFKGGGTHKGEQAWSILKLVKNKDNDPISNKQAWLFFFCWKKTRSITSVGILSYTSITVWSMHVWIEYFTWTMWLIRRLTRFQWHEVSISTPPCMGC